MNTHFNNITQIIAIIKESLTLIKQIKVLKIIKILITTILSNKVNNNYS